MSYTDAIIQRDMIIKQIEDNRSSYEDKGKKLKESLNNVNQQISVYELGQNADLFSVGKKFLEIEWYGNRVTTKEVTEQFEEAKEDIRHAFRKLRTSYFGVKEYEGFASQSVDCEYGMAPTYGSVWFSIGLRSEFRGAIFTESDLIAMVYYLNCVEKNPELLNY